MAKTEIILGESGGGGISSLLATESKSVAGSTAPSFTTTGTADIVFMNVSDSSATRMWTNLDVNSGGTITDGAYYSSTDGTWTKSTTNKFNISANSVSMQAAISTGARTCQLFYTVK